MHIFRVSSFLKISPSPHFVFVFVYSLLDETESNTQKAEESAKIWQHKTQQIFSISPLFFEAAKQQLDDDRWECCTYPHRLVAVLPQMRSNKTPMEQNQTHK